MPVDLLASLFQAPLVLKAGHVRLEPLALEHTEELFAIGQEEEIWRWLYLAPPTTVEEMRARVVAALSAKSSHQELPFVVVDNATSSVIGTTRYMGINQAHRTLEIEWTWYHHAFWRTAVNTECKYLLLRHAVESLKCVRVQLTTDLRNERSQRAMERLGVTREGILRKNRIVPKDGYHRSSVCYSIIDDQWPEVKARIESLLRAHGKTA
jgi:RimJ/RimL family protein N-acetyltransferase